jgi:hypothetical protein
MATSDRVAVLEAVLKVTELAAFRELKKKHPEAVKVWMCTTGRWCVEALSSLEGRERARKLLHWLTSQTTFPKLVEIELWREGRSCPRWTVVAASDVEAIKAMWDFRHFSKVGPVEKIGAPWAEV